MWGRTGSGQQRRGSAPAPLWGAPPGYFWPNEECSLHPAARAAGKAACPMRAPLKGPATLFSFGQKYPGARGRASHGKRASLGRPFLSFHRRGSRRISPVGKVTCHHCFKNHSVIFDTTPAPTVRPPSRIAKRRPCSIAMGAISSTSNFRLSPGITISVPAGRVTVPVTSVVRK